VHGLLHLLCIRGLFSGVGNHAEQQEDTVTGLDISVASAEGLEVFKRWAEAEQWNPGRSDILPFRAADPAGFLIGRLDGEPVASISAVRYGDGFGFIGFYIVAPEFRGQGHGLAIWQAAMRRLAGRNVGLDGVVEQQDNYRRSGFRSVWNHVRYEGAPTVERPASDITFTDGRSVPFDQLAAYDRRYFPAERSSFLSLWVSLPPHVSVAAVRDGELQGFGVLRPSHLGSRIGPLYAESEEVAAALVGRLAASVPGQSVAIDVPDANRTSIKLMERLGLLPTFECARMYTGPTPAIDLDGVFAATTVELG
jgi:ribosomal protein S18 acetylase RimI-like enzyme